MGTPEGGTYTSTTLIIDKKKGTFIPDKVGKHQITYTAQDGQENISVDTFIVPNTMTISNAYVENSWSVVEIILPTPPKELVYSWLWSINQSNPVEVKTVKEKKEGTATRYFIVLPDIVGGDIIFLRFTGKTICRELRAVFSILL